MLIQYSVENYKSIKNEIVINFSAKLSEKNNEWIADDIGNYLYKGIGLIGPNASGKSNILDSFYFAVNFVKDTIIRKDTTKIKVEPFLLDDNYKKHNTNFEFIFINEGIKYVYGFSVNTHSVDEEYLLAYYSSKPTTLFDRTDCNKYDFKGNDLRIQNELKSKTNDNRLYLAVAAEWGYEKAVKAYKWFDSVLKQYEDYSIVNTVTKIINNEKKKNMLIEAMSKADLNITDLYVQSEKMEKKSMDFMKQLFSQFVPELDVETLSDSRPIIFVTHKNSSRNEFSIPLSDDSAGTEKALKSIAELLYVGETGGMILEDELGKVYHSRLTKHFLDIFKNVRNNPKGAQLFFSSHDTKILNLLDPDQIYLVDKDEEGATYVKLLSDYSIRDTDNVELGYLKGRYGAVPYMKE